jgi:hypothetical protein
MPQGPGVSAPPHKQQQQRLQRTLHPAGGACGQLDLLRRLLLPQTLRQELLQPMRQQQQQTGPHLPGALAGQLGTQMQALLLLLLVLLAHRHQSLHM